MQEIFYYIGSFCLFIILQSLAINGIYYAFSGGCLNDIDKGKICKGNIFFLINPDFFDKNKDKEWARPIFSCVRCMASTYSIITYWPVVLYLFGFHWIEIFVWVFDVCILASLNWLIFRKL